MPVVLIAVLAYLALSSVAVLPLRGRLRPDETPFALVVPVAGLLTMSTTFYYVLQHEPYDLTTMDFVMRYVKIFGAGGVVMFGMSALLYLIAPNETDPTEHNDTTKEV